MDSGILLKSSAKAKEFFPHSSLIVYGSFAKGNQSNRSDLDLIVVCGPKDFSGLSAGTIKSFFGKGAVPVKERHVKLLKDGSVDHLYITHVVDGTRVSVHFYERGHFCELVRNRSGRFDKRIVIPKEKRARESHVVITYKGKKLTGHDRVLDWGIDGVAGSEVLRGGQTMSVLLSKLLSAKVVLDGAGIRPFLEKNAFNKVVLETAKHRKLFSKKKGKVVGLKQAAFSPKNFLSLFYQKPSGNGVSQRAKQAYKKKYSAYAKKVDSFFRRRRKL